MNDGPVAADDTLEATEDTPITTANVLDNDTDLDGDKLSVESFTQAEHGTVKDNGDGTFTYAADANYNGPDSFTYTISDGNGGTDTATVDIKVAAANDGPVAADDTLAATEDTPITTGNVLTNDTDIEGDTLSVDSFTQPAHGTVADNGDGTFTYAADANYNGPDSFTYTVSDGNGGTDTATVDIKVAAVNDGPVATDDTLEATEDTPVTTGNVLDNDTDLDGDKLSVESFTQPEHGTVKDNGDGTFTYAADANYNGADSFTYTVTDGNGGTDTATVNVNVAAVNDGPDAVNDTLAATEDTPITTGNVLTNDTDLEGDTLSVSSFTQADHGTVADNGDGTFTYIPDANYNGADSFTYTVSDGNGGTDTATVNIEVAAVDDDVPADRDEVVMVGSTPVTQQEVVSDSSPVEEDDMSVLDPMEGLDGAASFNHSQAEVELSELSHQTPTLENSLSGIVIPPLPDSGRLELKSDEYPSPELPDRADLDFDDVYSNGSIIEDVVEDSDELLLEDGVIDSDDVLVESKEATGPVARSGFTAGLWGLLSGAVGSRGIDDGLNRTDQKSKKNLTGSN